MRESETIETRLSDETCALCGSPLCSPQGAPAYMRIAATADYVCLHCGRAYKRMRNLATLQVLWPAAQDYNDEHEEP
jgi:hypothetical protein